MNLLEQFTANTQPGPFYETDGAVTLQSTPLVKLIAFYLPQFHAIPENDEWWGEGFTEWTNVTKAIPRFAGHYQPRLPGAMGFYDATRPEVLKRQAEMARRYGIHGFCFHYYWFSGRRVLERPLETLLAHPEIDIPFCVNWANESWTRRWDGRERSILIEQRHAPEDDIPFARSLEPLFRDRRYIRIDGRPLMMIYRPALFPDAKLSVSRWREYFSSTEFGNPYIAMVQTHGDSDPERYGMDAAVGFPPFFLSYRIPPRLDLDLLDPQYAGKVRDYKVLAQATIDSYRTDPKTFPGIIPSWDNDARTPGRGSCFNGSTPEIYGQWLHAACHASLRNFRGDERLVFINAWNEWAEGAYLEPDRHFGFSYLAETCRVLNSLVPKLEQQPLPQTDAEWAPAAITFKRRLRRVARLTLDYFANIAEEVAWRLRRRR